MMDPQRVFAIAKKVLKIFRHDRRTLGFVIGMPLVLIVVFGYTFGGEVQNARVMVYNEDAGAIMVAPGGNVTLTMADDLLGHIDGDVIDLSIVDTAEKARSEVNDADAWGAIFIPANFSANVINALMSNGSIDAASLEILLEGTNPTISIAIMQQLNSAMISTMDQLADEHNLTKADSPINITISYEYGGEDIEFIDNFAPAIIAFAIMMVTIMLTIIVFVQEREDGTLARLLVSPATETEIVIGHAAAFGIIGLLQSIVILMIAIVLFGITIQGSILLTLFMILLLGLGHQGLGILLSSAAKNEFQAIQFIPIILFPSLLLSGMLWPIESIPEVLQPLSRLIPLSYAIDALRGIMIRGWGVGDILFEMTALFVFLGLTIGASIKMLEKRE